MPGLFERLLMKVFRYEDIGKDIDGVRTVYLRRFFLWQRGKSGGGNVFLHKVYRSDDDRLPHTHPWDWTTVILKGGYEDEQYGWDGCARYFLGYQHCKPGQMFFRPAEHLHRLQLIDGKPAWTLVITGPWRRPWTFISEAGEIPWYEFLKVNPKTGEPTD